MLIPSPVRCQPVLHKVSPNSTQYTSGEIFTLTGLGFSPDDQIVLLGNPPKTIWQIPAIEDPNADITSIYIQNNHAYIIEGSTTLHILDVGVPDQFRLIGSLTDPRFVKLKQMWATERFLYMIDSGYGLWVVNLSDPNQPSLMGNGEGYFSYSTESPSRLYIEGKNIFLTNWTGLRILVQNDNGRINARGFIQISGIPYDVSIKDNLAYVATGSTVQIIDVTNPDNPTSLIDPNDPNDISKIDHIPSESSNIERLLIKDNMLYISDRFYGIHVADLSIPTEPQIISSLNIQEEIKDIYLCGPFALLANGFDGLQIIDFHEKENPLIYGNIHTFGNATAIASYTYYLYVANGKKGLSIVEAPSFFHPNLQSYITTGDNIWAITSQNDHAYISNGRSGLKVIKTYPSWNPETISTIQTEKEATYSFVKENMLYLADSTKFKPYDISNISTPLPMGELKLIDPIMSIYVQGNNAYLADLGFGVQCVNIINLSLSSFKFSNNENGLAYDIVLDQTCAYLANGEGGLWIVDFQDPFHPVTLSEFFQLGYANNLKKYNNLIYMTKGSYGIEIIDVSSPNNPNHIDTIDYNDFLKEVDIEFPFLYTVCDLQGIWVNHLSEDGEITPIDVINLPFGASAVKSDGDLIYCGDDYGNFHIFSSPVQARIIPPILNNEIKFYLNLDLPAGSYNIFLISKSEEDVDPLEKAINVYQSNITFCPGLNILSYPGFVPFENIQAFPLLINLAKQSKGSNLQIKKIMWMKKIDPKSESFSVAFINEENQPDGDNFDILPLRGYPIYATGTQKKEFFLASHPLKMTESELIKRLKSEITPGRNLISLPFIEDSLIKYSDLITSETQPEISSIQEWDANKGEWYSGYHFFNTLNGKVKNLIGGHGYLVSVH